MDTGNITQLISSVGFPIVVCLICFWYINKNSEQHKSEMENITQAINNNTIALTQLVERMDKGEDNE